LVQVLLNFVIIRYNSVYDAKMSVQIRQNLMQV